MHPHRRGPRVALATLGGLAVVAGATLGIDAVTGYGPRTYLIHVGVFAMLLAVVPTFLARTDRRVDHRGIRTAGLAFGGLYLLSIGLLWMGVVPAPEFPVQPSVVDVAVDRLGILLSLLPVAAGYILGATAHRATSTRPRAWAHTRRSRRSHAPSPGRWPGRQTPNPRAFAIVAAFLGPFFGLGLIAVGPGGATLSGLAIAILYVAALLGGAVVAIPFYAVARRGYGDGDDVGGAPGNTSDSID